ncbi:MAG: CBS domain-containing protein [Planctomycetes bacterium]|nr:CBS domain-containing protein [Planctomycetota bacterium]
MECPSCSHENIEGADQCARCHADLSCYDELGEGSDIERDLLRRPLGDLLAQDYIVVAPDCSVRETIQRWRDGTHHCAVVVDQGAIVGIFTERDVLTKLAADFDRHGDDPVSVHMTPDPVTLETHTPIAYGLNRMMTGGYRHIPLVSDGKLCGIVSVRQILEYLAERCGDVIGAATPA